MNTNTKFTQPDFAENVVATVRETLKAAGADTDLSVARPDYDHFLDLNNLFRTTMYLDQGPHVPVQRAVHLSNLLYGDQDTMAVVYESGADGMAKQTHIRYYQSPIKMALKDHAVSNIGHRNEAFIHQDIAEFLHHGNLPS